jgi:hypothetical protein
MSVRTVELSVLGLVLAGLFAAAGEAPGKGGKPKPQAEFEIKPPFDALVVGKADERMTAFTALIPKAAELAEAARAEAARLKALPTPEEPTATRQRILDAATGALDALVAEAEAMKAWKPGLPAAAEKVQGKTVPMDCKDQPIGAVLKKAAAGWGLGIELSPAAVRTVGALGVDLEGSPSLRQFLEWLAAEQGLICGQSGEKVVLVPAGSLKLRENIEKAGGGKK